MKKALLFGATGLIGNFILDLLLKSTAYETVTAVVRKSLDLTDPRLQVLTGDLSTLPTLKDQLIGDDVFIALGTTKKNTPDEKKYYQVDHDYPVMAAKLARDNGATSVFVVSSVGADAGASTFYLRTKGELERDLIALDYDHVHIFRPSMLLGNRKESRPLEKALITVFRTINPVFVGKMSRFRGIEAEEVARAMVKAAGEPAGDVTFYEWKEMRGLAQA